MRKKHNRSKESDSRLSPVVAGKHKALCLGRDCDYPKELRRLQIELVKLQEWVRHKGLRVVALFEGRDAAGKGGAIKRITESLFPAFGDVLHALLESVFLFFIAYRKPILHEDQAGSNQHPLEFGATVHELETLGFTAESHYMLDAGPVVPTPVE